MINAPLTTTLQTPPGRGGIAVITLSGDDCQDVLGEVFRPLRSHALGGDDVLRLGHLMEGLEVIDEAIVCCRPGACEINIHSGPAVARRMMQLLADRGAIVQPAEPAATKTFRLAHPSWNNPAIGLEMLQALSQARSEPVVWAITQQWSAGLSRLAAEALTAAQKRKAVESLSPRLRTAGQALATMQRLLNPAEVVLAGEPNVGKSTLANALIGREVSLVHAQPGTTRDWVRELAVLGGLPVWLTDTAGLWETDAPIDAEAVRRARQRAEQADLVLLVSTERPTTLPDWLHVRDKKDKNVLSVWAKADLAPPPTDFAGPAVSALTGEGLEELKQAILTALGLANFDPTRPMALTPRQADLLTRAADSFDAGDTTPACQCLEDLLSGNPLSKPTNPL
jgi:tRNA modification GTPase